MKYHALVLIAAALVATGCTDNAQVSPAPASAADTRKLSVQATDTACTLSAAAAPTGTLTFAVTNAGTKLNEFYLLSADGKKVIGEVEDIGPGLTRELVVTVPAGDYLSACKPGASGDGIRAQFTVTNAEG